MNNLNFIFLEEYKHLDKLCSELYDGQPGVTSYINAMKNMDWNDTRQVSNWRSDLNNLIRLRHIRNHLAHTEGSFNEKLCTSVDVNWVKDFRNRILKQTDPLAMLRINSKEITRYENESSFWSNLFLVISIAIAIFTVVYILVQT